MVYNLVYTESAQKDLLKIEKNQVQKILMKMDNYMKLENPLTKAKKLKNFRIETYRFRVGDYRVVFRLDKKTNKLVILVVLKIAHRKDVYKK